MHEDAAKISVAQSVQNLVWHGELEAGAEDDFAHVRPLIEHQEKQAASRDQTFG